MKKNALQVISIRPDMDFSIVNLQNKNNVYFKSSVYAYWFTLPVFINIIFDKTKNSLIFKNFNTYANSKQNGISVIYTLMKEINKIMKYAYRGFKKKILLEGVGYKFVLSKDKKFLLFKVGFSTVITVPVPKLIRIKIIGRKFNVLRAYCHNQVTLNNFIHEVVQVRRPDPYKGKGVHAIKIVKKFKEVKKKK